MARRRLQILQVSTQDIVGGAERVAWNLFRYYRDQGHVSRLAVGRKHSHDPDVVVVPNTVTKPWARFWLRAEGQLRAANRQNGRHLWQVRLIRRMAEPMKALNRYRGIEDFDLDRKSVV